MTNDEKDKRFERKVIIILILLIAIIILLLFCHFGKIGNQGLIPTGNVDVFDIDIYCNHKRAQVPSDNKNDYGKKNNNTNDNNKNENKISENIADNGNKDNNNNEVNNETNNEISNETENENVIEEFEGITFDEFGRKLTLYNEETDKNTLGVSFINQQEGNYIFQQRLNIFNNAAYQYKAKIAPGVSNTYHFVVHNSNTLDVKYIMEMYEESEYPVNLKYRLKNDDNYVIGNETNWVTVDELKTNFKRLNKGVSDNYALEWKWFDDDANDNIAGENMKSEYKLNIRFYFEAL